MSELISIIVPIYKVERYLRQCLDSITGQTYRNLEIILLDDGSPDNCGSICDDYAARDDRITVIHKENAGVGAARNDGINACQGRWVMFVDPDDWLEKDCCMKLMETVKTDSWDIVYFQRQINGEQGELLEEIPYVGSFELDREMLRQVQLDSLADYVCVHGFESTSPWGKLYSRDIIDKYHCRFPESLPRRQDVIFNLYCLEYIQKAYFLDYAGYHYRRNIDSICCRYSPNMMEMQSAFLQEIERFVKEKHPAESEYARKVCLQVVSIQGDLRGTLLFHPEHPISYREYLGYMKRYYDDPVVRRYLGKCRYSDFKATKDKILCYLLSKHHVKMYYCMIKLHKWLIKSRT